MFLDEVFMLKIIGAFFVLLVGLLVIRKEPSYWLNRLVAASFLLFSLSNIFEALASDFWFIIVAPMEVIYSWVVIIWCTSVITGIFSTLLFLLSAILIRYGSFEALRPRVLLSTLTSGIALSIVVFFNQIIYAVPDPIKGTVVYWNLAGLVALFVVPALITLASVIIMLTVYPDLENPKAKRSVLLLAVGVLFLILGILPYALSGLFPLFQLLPNIGMTLFWTIGSLLCFLAFQHKIRG
ncbi:MAG: hypothetical protein ACFFDP_11945 [Promethearchaeota archaeon]